MRNGKIADVGTVKMVWRGGFLLILLVAAAGSGCGGSGKSTGDAGTGGQSGAGGQEAGAGSLTPLENVLLSTTTSHAVDILFVVSNWTSTAEIQQKLLRQIPAFLSILKSAPTALDLHIAVTTADMGAPGDALGTLNCTAQGDGGKFRSGGATASCLNTTLTPGATYLTDDGSGTTNFTGSLTDAVQCIADVGNSGCGFGQPLAAAVRALGADDIQSGTPNPPATNVGFLRPDAYLAIILLVNRDDCSPPANTELFSLQGQPDNLTNPLGPLEYYRCNQFGHLCQDPSAPSPLAQISPPLEPPSHAQGTAAAPTLALDNCFENDTDTGLLTPVGDFVGQLKAIKTNAYDLLYPDNRIVIAALTAPASPYAVAWTPAPSGQDAQPGELWPAVQASCGPSGPGTNPAATQLTTDGSFGEPGVRVSEFVSEFSLRVVGSACDPSYAATMQAIATDIVQLPAIQNCVGPIQMTPAGLPNCIVGGSPVGVGLGYPNCATNGGAAPCWTANPGIGSCLGSSTFSFTGLPGSDVVVSCIVCNPGAISVVPGC